MEEIITHFSVKALKNSVSLPVHEPISFGFEEIVKAKAEADAAISAEIERRLIEMSLGIGEGYRCAPYQISERSSDEASVDVNRLEYIYDYNLAAELSEIKRRNNRKQ